MLSRRDISELLKANGLAPRRALGQNFVADPNTVRRIARLAAVGTGDRVLEIGAGLGSLTMALAATGAAVTAMEVDRGLVPVLSGLVEPLGVTVVEADATSVSWPVLLGAGPWVVVANLPYNVATPIVMNLLEQAPTVTRLLVMVQAEVADRLAASPGSSAYGAVSCLVSYWATARVVGRVPATVFVPRPKVESALVSVVRRPSPPVDTPYDELKTLIRAGFAHRRKMLRGALAGSVSPEAFVAAGVESSARAEQLGIEDWGRLAESSRSSPTPS